MSLPYSVLYCTYRPNYYCSNGGEFIFPWVYLVLYGSLTNVLLSPFPLRFYLLKSNYARGVNSAVVMFMNPCSFCISHFFPLFLFIEILFYIYICLFTQFITLYFCCSELNLLSNDEFNPRFHWYRFAAKDFVRLSEHGFGA